VAQVSGFSVGDRMVFTLTFEQAPDFAVPFQWRDYDVVLDDPGPVTLGVPVEVTGRIVGVRRQLQ
jgi:hypothetical protein